MTTTLDFVPADLLTGASQTVNDEIAGVDEVSELVEALSIDNQNDLQQAVQIAAMLMDAGDEIEAKRVQWTKPLNEVVASINVAFSPILDRIDKVTRVIKNKIETAVKDADTEGEKLLEQVATASPEQRESILKRVEEISFDKVKGLSFRRTSKPTITSESAVVDWVISNRFLHLLKVDTKALTGMLANFETPPTIPGVELKETKTVVITRSVVGK